MNLNYTILNLNHNNIFQVLSTEFRRRALVGEVRLSKPNQALIERFGDVKKRLMAGAGKVRRGE